MTTATAQKSRTKPAKDEPEDEGLEEMDEPVLSFSTTTAATARPTLRFKLDERTVTATAPKAARWARMWAAGASGNTQLMCFEWFTFVDVCLGDEVARWLKDRENDPDDPYDIPDLINLVRFLNKEFEPYLKPEFETSGVRWQQAEAKMTPEGRAAKRARSSGKGQPGSKAATRKAAPARKS